MIVREVTHQCLYPSIGQCQKQNRPSGTPVPSCYMRGVVKYCQCDISRVHSLETASGKIIPFRPSITHLRTVVRVSVVVSDKLPSVLSPHYTAPSCVLTGIVRPDRLNQDNLHIIIKLVIEGQLAYPLFKLLHPFFVEIHDFPLLITDCFPGFCSG